MGIECARVIELFDTVQGGKLAAAGKRHRRFPSIFVRHCGLSLAEAEQKLVCAPPSDARKLSNCMRGVIERCGLQFHPTPVDQLIAL